MSKICTNNQCKKEIQDSATFCPFCGMQQVDDANLTEEERLRKELAEQQRTLEALRTALENKSSNAMTTHSMETTPKPTLHQSDADGSSDFHQLQRTSNGHDVVAATSPNHENNVQPQNPVRVSMITDTPELTKWNWGAFTFGWVWGVCNGVFWPLILIPLYFIPVAGSIISIIFMFVAGINGTKWAWNAQKGKRDVLSFTKRQESWSRVGKAVFIIELLIIPIVVIIAIVASL